jgi:hypothetical protein
LIKFARSCSRAHFMKIIFLSRLLSMRKSILGSLLSVKYAKG